MALGTVIGFTQTKLMDALYNKIKSLVTEKKITIKLNDYLTRYKTDIYNNFGIDEEYDWEGLINYVKDEIVTIIADCFLLPYKDVRKRMIDQLHRRSYIKASALTVTKQNRINDLLNGVMILIDESLRGSMENTIPFNMVVDEISNLIGTWEVSLRDELNEYTETVVSSISEYFDTTYDKINYIGSFAEWVDGMSLPQVVNTQFHYRNPNIQFHGRKAEMQFFNDFLSASAPILFTAVTGSAGVGKSKLLYEYAKIMEANAEWKVVFLAASVNVRLLTEYKNYNYPLNLLVIIDYAGDYATELAEWMVVLRSSLNKPPKIRIVLIERASISMNEAHIDNEIYSNNETLIEFPLWYKRMLDVRSCDDVKAMLYQFDTASPFLYLIGLEDDDLLKIMDDYVRTNEREITQDRLKGVLSYCRHTVEQGRLGVRPLIALFVIDAWLNNEEYRSWNLGQLLEKLINRYIKQWKDGLCNGDEKIYKSLENLIVFATASGGWDTLDSLPQLFKSDLLTLQDKYDVSELNERFREVNEKITWDGILSPLEPDLVGEFFVLHKMLKSHPNKRLDMVNAFITNYDYFTFVDRCANDYSMSDMFKGLFGNAMETLLPSHAIDNHPMTKSILLFNLLLNQEKGEMEKIVEEMRILTEEYGNDKRLLRNYVKGLLFLSGEQGTEECIITVNKIRDLLEKDVLNQEIASQYAAGLVNIISEQSLPDAFGTLTILKNLMLEYKYNDEVLAEYAKGLFNISNNQEIEGRLITVKELESLSDDHAGNESVIIFYAQALVNLANAQEKDAAKQTMAKLRDLLIDHNQDEELWLAYMKRLVTLLINQTKDDGNEMVEELEKITKAYPDNDLMVVEYVNGLYNHMNMKDKADWSGDLETLRLIADRYEHIDEVLNTYMQAIFNFVNNHDQEKRASIVNDIAMLDERFGHNEVFAFGYARCLYLLASEQTPTDAARTVETLYNLMERFGSNEEIAYHAAFGLHNLMYEQEVIDAEITLEKIKKISERFENNVKIVFAYAAGLSTFTYFQNAVDGAATVFELQSIYKRFCDDSDIAHEYAQGLVNLSAEQNIEDCILSVECLRILWEKFADNDNIALKYAEGLYNSAEKQNKRERASTLSEIQKLCECYSQSEKIKSVFEEAMQL